MKCITLIAVALCALLVWGETLASRQALFDFYQVTSNRNADPGEGGWAARCSAGGWRTMGTLRDSPPIFCNIDHSPDPANSQFSTFFGIHCSGLNGDVFAIVLTGCALQGTLLASLLAVSSLNILYLHRNALTGSLPPEWSNFQELTRLSFAENQLSGPLPPSYALLAKLIDFEIQSNQLTGTLPSEYSLLGPTLEYFDAAFNQLEGTLPSSWSSLKLLTLLRLRGNQLTGTLPSLWSALSNLGSLFLEENQLSGSLPVSWTSMFSLVTLSLDDNQLSGTLPKEWGNFFFLESLYLMLNQFEGTLPSEWSALASTLQTLSLYGNRLTGTLPSSWGMCENIKRFLAMSNQLSGSIPASYARWKRTLFFHVEGNQLSGTLPPELSAWGATIVSFGVDHNQLSGTLPPSWASWTSVLDFRLQFNQLTGTLPAAWSAMSQIQQFTVNVNALDGTLPPQWANWSNLITFFVSRNQLTGTLPPEYSSMTALQQFDIRSNRFVGTLPSSYSSWRQLIRGYFDTNLLTGSLPPQWSAWGQVQQLWFNFNWLNGTLPRSWGPSMGNLVELRLHGNSITGTVPKEWPEGMRRLNVTGNYCVVRCQGGDRRGVQPMACQTIASIAPTCVMMSVWYNCLEGILPPVNASNTWNWGERLFLTPQRNDCMTPSASVTVSGDGDSQSSTVTWSVSNATPTWSETEPLLLNRRGVRIAVRFSDASNGVATVAAVAASFTAGASMGTAVQRASLQRALLECLENLADRPSDLLSGGEEAHNAPAEPLDIASSPTRLGLGDESDDLFFVRGSVIGNLVVLVALALCGLAGIAVWRVVRHRRELQKGFRRPWCDWSQAARPFLFPGVLHVPVMFLFQPIVSSSVACLDASSLSNGMDVAIGLIGLAASLSYAFWAIWVCTCGRRAHALVRRIAPRRDESSSLHAIRRLVTLIQERTPGVVRRVVFGWSDSVSRWKDLPADRPGFVERYGVILGAYRATGQWYILVDVLVSFWVGVIQGLIERHCHVALPACYLVVSLVSLIGLCVVQPYSAATDHTLALVSWVLSILWCAGVLHGTEQSFAVASITSDVQMWSGALAIVVALLVAVVGDEENRDGSLWRRGICGWCFRRAAGGQRTTSSDTERPASSADSQEDDEREVTLQRRRLTNAQPLALVAVGAAPLAASHGDPQPGDMKERQRQRALQVLVSKICAQSQQRRAASTARISVI